jgi:SOS-response transcriptional repressor LexA
MSDDNPTRDQVFEFIVEYKREHDGISPSVREIAEGCVLSESTVKYHLLKLENERRILVKGRRAIEVVGGEWNLPDEEGKAG